MQADEHRKSQTDKLVSMANQIARAFAVHGEARAVPQIAEHMRLFWDPKMRAGLAAHLDSGAIGLDDFALKAVRSLA